MSIRRQFVRSSRRRRGLGIERLETREVLSTYAGVLARGQIVAERQALATTEALASQSHTGVATPSVTSAAVNASTPTPREIRRQTFVAKFKGVYFVGPPQFTDESQRIFFNVSGGSNQIFTANGLVVINTPSSGSQPTTRATANLFGRDIATTGSDLILDLSAAPLGNPRALPTHLTWTIHGASAGTYSLATMPADPNNPGVTLAGNARHHVPPHAQRRPGRGVEHGHRDSGLPGIYHHNGCWRHRHGVRHAYVSSRSIGLSPKLGGRGTWPRGTCWITTPSGTRATTLRPFFAGAPLEL